MTRVSGDWLTAPDTQAFMAALEARGHQALFVGGCVRNALLDVAISDVDISTSAHPQTAMKIAEDIGLRPHPTGIDHGTITVATSDRAIEVTTFRRDVRTDGRRAVVAFATTIEEDALRRDFTMNALYATRDGTIVDPIGGLPDLQARCIRFIEDPENRIKEDYLRILRFFRFFAFYGSTSSSPDPDGLAACAKLSDGLRQLSKERVGTEVIKLLSAKDPASAMASMEHTGCLAQVLPGATSKFLAPLVHLEGGIEVNPIRRLSVLGGDGVSHALRLSRAQARDLERIRDGASGSMNAMELGYRCGEVRAKDALLVRHALLGQPLPSTTDTDIAVGASAVFPVQALDLMPEYSGPLLGARLTEIESLWVSSGFSMTKKDLLR